MGGPLGRWKIKKYGLKPLTSEVEQNANLGEPETVYQTKAEMLNSETSSPPLCSSSLPPAWAPM